MAKLLFTKVVQLSVEVEVPDEAVAALRPNSGVGENKYRNAHDLIWDACFKAMYTPKFNRRKGVDEDPIDASAYVIVNGEQEEEPLVQRDY